MSIDIEFALLAARVVDTVSARISSARPLKISSSGPGAAHLSRNRQTIPIFRRTEGNASWRQLGKA